MNKKAQGEVITTVLIILLVLAAVVIVWQAVRGTVTESTENLESGAACIGLDMVVTKADISTTAGKVYVTRNAGGPEADATVVVLVNGAVVTPGCADDALGQLESTTCTLGDALVATDEVTVGGKIDGTACPSVSDVVNPTAA